MSYSKKTRIFMSGRSQHVTIPAEYRFAGDEVYIRRDMKTGDLIVSQAPGGWDDFFAAVDNVGFPDDFLTDRNQGKPETRESL